MAPVSDAPAAPMAKNGMLLFLGGGRHCEAHAGVGAAEHHGQAGGVGPLAELLLADVGLVLVVGGEDVDRLAQHRAAELRDRHLDRLDAARADDVRVGAGHVVDVADHHLVRRGLGRSGGEERAQRSGRGQHAFELSHRFPP